MMNVPSVKLVGTELVLILVLLTILVLPLLNVQSTVIGHNANVHLASQETLTLNVFQSLMENAVLILTAQKIAHV